MDMNMKDYMGVNGNDRIRNNAKLVEERFSNNEFNCHIAIGMAGE